MNEAPELINKSVVASDAVKLGDKIKVTADAEGGTGSYKYVVYYRHESKDTFSTKGTDPQCEIAPSQEGTYYIKIKVTDKMGTISEKIIPVTVYDLSKFKNTSTIDATEIAAGESVTISASAEGGAGGYTYMFYKTFGGRTGVLQRESSNSQCTAVFSEPGSYSVIVLVRDRAGNDVNQMFNITVV